LPRFFGTDGDDTITALDGDAKVSTIQETDTYSSIEAFRLRGLPAAMGQVFTAALAVDEPVEPAGVQLHLLDRFEYAVAGRLSAMRQLVRRQAECLEPRGRLVIGCERRGSSASAIGIHGRLARALASALATPENRLPPRLRRVRNASVVTVRPRRPCARAAAAASIFQSSSSAASRCAPRARAHGQAERKPPARAGPGGTARPSHVVFRENAGCPDRALAVRQ
jgi:hypothetical protein